MASWFMSCLPLEATRHFIHYSRVLRKCLHPSHGPFRILCAMLNEWPISTTIQTRDCDGYVFPRSDSPEPIDYYLRPWFHRRPQRRLCDDTWPRLLAFETR